MLLLLIIPPAEASLAVLVSAAMPKPLLEAVLADARAHQATVVLNGYLGASLRQTLQTAARWQAQSPGLKLAIDPTLFERLGIHQVPALVASHHGHPPQVLLGNLSIDRALERLKDAGGCDACP